MQQRQIGPFKVSALGQGCMSLSHAYGTPPAEQDAERVLLAALDEGVTLFDTAALYGFGANETLVGRVLRPHRQRITLCSKGGLGGVAGDDGVMRRMIDGRPQSLLRQCEDSLRRLQTDVIDLYYLHRWDKSVPIEDSVGALSRLVEQGKVRAIGLSEVSAATVRKAHAVHPVVAVQNEYSLWSRNAELGVLDTCREIGAALVAFSPLGRGFLADGLHDVSTLVPKDIRRNMPRFEPANYAANLGLLAPYRDLAAEAGCTPAQLALAWLLHKAPHIVPIPGTAREAHVRENMRAAGVHLPADLLGRLEALINEGTVHGNRYNEQSRREVDTEEFGQQG